MRKKCKQWKTLFSWAPKSVKMGTAAMKLKMLAPWKKTYDNHRQHIEKQRHYFANKGPSCQGYTFPSGHVWIWELDHDESWAPKNWCFWTVVLEKILESLLDCKKIKPVNPMGNQSWIIIGRTDAEAETPIVWLPDTKRWLTGKDSDTAKDWRQEEKKMAEDEKVGWHHGLNGREFEQAPGVGDGQGSLACCSSWGRQESNMTEWLNWIELNWAELGLTQCWLAPGAHVLDRWGPCRFCSGFNSLI